MVNSIDCILIFKLGVKGGKVVDRIPSRHNISGLSWVGQLHLGK